MHMLGGLDRPTSGKVFVDDKDIFTLKDEALTIFRRRKIGFVFQAFNLVPVLNVYENIVLPIELDGNEVDEAYVEQIIEVLGLKEKKNSMPSQLSGGQQQRVAIAVALANEPKLLLADEPTGAVDEKTAKQIQELFYSLNEELHVTIIIVTHDPTLAGRVKRVVMISDGKIGTEKIMREAYQEKLRAVEGKEFSLEDREASHDEYAVLDRSGRVQLSEAVREAAGISSKKVKITVEQGQVVIKGE